MEDKSNYINNVTSSIIQCNGETYVNGKKIDIPKSILFNNTIVQINNKLYVNGRELKNGKWKLTLRAIGNCLF